MIRVLQIVTYMGRGGLETMLMNYYRHMDHSKVQFDFLVHRDFEADYDQEIQKMGGRIYHISRLIPWSRTYRNELKKFFTEHSEYRMVHVHQDCLSSVALQCAEECGVPVRIAHSHSASAVKNVKYPIKVHYMKQISRYATNLLACGEKAGDWMFGENCYQIVRNAIDPADYCYFPDIAKQVREELQSDDCFIVGHVGNFTAAKNYAFLLDIFREVLKLRSNAKLLLVGGGNDWDIIRDKVKAMGIQEQVIFTGIRTDVNRLMQAMDVFVFPSLYEGLPVAMIEAQAAGLPCMISDRISEECIVTNGLVVSKSLNESPSRWAEDILKQVHHPRENHMEEIQDAGYDILTAASQLEKFYIRNSRE
ncbi:MAG: glycosyltransferase family 1 protein [Eubacterium sp.]|nr:glycosyltransferase family 1 protein [Eubacterium sp.]